MPVMNIIKDLFYTLDDMREHLIKISTCRPRRSTKSNINTQLKQAWRNIELFYWAILAGSCAETSGYSNVQ